MTASFGSIPHAELVRSVTRRIVDRRVLHLIKMWLECPVEETDDRGRKTRTTEARDNRRGIPQGSPISPLLANLSMRRFVLYGGHPADHSIVFGNNSEIAKPTVETSEIRLNVEKFVWWSPEK